MKSEKDPMTPGEDQRELPARPFFARFLEGQRAEADTTTANRTLKYPSDRDEIDWALDPSHLS